MTTKKKKRKQKEKPFDPDNGFWAVIVETQKQLLLHSDERGQITAFLTAEKGRDFFEQAYDRGHARGYEGSMSACIHNVFFRPSIVYFENAAAVEVLFDVKNVEIASVWSAAGGMHGIICNKKRVARALWKKGIKPRLMKNEDEYIESYGSLDAKP